MRPTPTPATGKATTGVDMRTITKEQLTEILDKHRKWRRGEADGALPITPPAKEPTP